MEATRGHITSFAGSRKAQQGQAHVMRGRDGDYDELEDHSSYASFATTLADVRKKQIGLYGRPVSPSSLAERDPYAALLAAQPSQLAATVQAHSREVRPTVPASQEPRDTALPSGDRAAEQTRSNAALVSYYARLRKLD